MTVKCERGMIWSYILIMPAPIVMFFIFYHDTGSLKQAFLFSLPIVFVWLFIAIPALVSVARTFVFNKDGCMIELLGYRKMIPWSRIKYIRIESYASYHVSYQDPYSGGIIFTTKRLYHSTKARVTNYNSFMRPFAVGLFHPFSHIYVYFEANPPVQYTRFNRRRQPREFCVDENTFINLLKEWNVPLPQKTKID